ncbi:hypothetical protein FGB62_21g28 [Gracilaria domingensis]|nr:hypothetical protein FGB62_21g28 [Gracilaria domingensis]
MAKDSLVRDAEQAGGITDGENENETHHNSHGPQSARSQLTAAEYTAKDVMHLLHLVVQCQPHADSHWARVASEYATYARLNGRAPRTWANLKQKFEQILFAQRKRADLSKHPEFRGEKHISKMILGNTSVPTYDRNLISDKVEPVRNDQRRSPTRKPVTHWALGKKRRANNIARLHSKRVLALLNCMDQVSDCMRWLAEAQLRRLTNEKSNENELNRLVTKDMDRSSRKQRKPPSAENVPSAHMQHGLRHHISALCYEAVLSLAAAWVDGLVAPSGQYNLYLVFINFT